MHCTLAWLSTHVTLYTPVSCAWLTQASCYKISHWNQQDMTCSFVVSCSSDKQGSNCWSEKFNSFYPFLRLLLWLQLEDTMSNQNGVCILFDLAWLFYVGFVLVSVCDVYLIDQCILNVEEKWRKDRFKCSTRSNVISDFLSWKILNWAVDLTYCKIVCQIAE